MSTSELQAKEDRPAFVRFERRPVEDREATNREGRYITKDADFALITPPYSKDCVEHEVSQWLINLKANVRGDRIPLKWFEQYEELYKRWQNGQEMPLYGTPIKGWPILSPAQQENLISMKVMTVEDLAQANDEGLRRMGMGGGDMREKARNWLNSAKDNGVVTMQMASLEADNKALRESVKSMSESMAELKALLTAQAKQSFQPAEAVPSRVNIALDDIMDSSPDMSEAKPARRKANLI